MGLINIDELLKLNRFRDLRKDGLERQVKIHEGKDTNGYIKTREITALEESKIIEKGIIDEIIRMNFRIKYIDYFYNCVQKRIVRVDAHMNHLIEFKKENELDVFFKAVAKQVKKPNSFLIRDSESNEEFECVSRVYAITALIELSEGKYNKTLKQFGFEINSVDDFKEVIQDKFKINCMMKVLYGSTKNMHRNDMKKMSNKGFYLDRYTDKEDGKRKYKLVRTDNTSLDATLEKCEDAGDKEETLYDKYVEESVFYERDKEVDRTNDILSYINQYEEVDKTNYILRYINENKEAILLKKQINTLSKFDSDGNYHGDNQGNINRSLIKKRMINSLDTHVDKDRFLYRHNGNINVRNFEYMKFFESIIMCNKRSEQFNIVIKSISKNDKLAQVIYDTFIKLPVCAYRNIIKKQLDYKYLNREFLQVLYALLDHYNFIAEVELKHFDLDEDDKIKFFIENYVMKEGVLVFSENNYDLVRVTELTSLINKIQGTEYKNIGDCKDYLEELGYKINTKSNTRRRNLNCYKIERL